MMDLNQTKMIETAIGLHAIIHFNTIEIFNLDINSLNATKYVWLKGNDNVIIENCHAINKIGKQNGIRFIVQSESILGKKIDIFGLITYQYEAIKSLKSQYPNLNIGGIANNLAAAKNVELFSGDFLYLGPLDAIGQSPYIAIIPKEPDYEWQFIDITIPVMSYGVSDNETLQTLTHNVNLFGHACPSQVFNELSETSYRFTSD